MANELEELEQSEWLTGEETGDRGGFWPRHLRLQAKRGLVVMLIVLLLLVLSRVGSPGRWVLRQLSYTAQIDYAQDLLELAKKKGDLGILSRLRGWFIREWQVNSSQLSLGEDAFAPSLSWPLSGGRILTAAELAPTGSGIDLQIPAGAPVLACLAGSVLAVSDTGDANQVVTLQHAGGWRTVYRLCAGALVREGDTIRAGQTIALVGSAPPPQPSHLHLELWGASGEIDPRPHLTSAPGADGRV